MTMEQSIIKTAVLYNKVKGYNAEKRVFNELRGKIELYEDVVENPVSCTTDEDGKIKSVMFGEDMVEV